ncbi:hypothetical protein Trisim1_000223 [Trichoderma cf. simile WF8]
MSDCLIPLISHRQGLQTLDRSHCTEQPEYTTSEFNYPCRSVSQYTRLSSEHCAAGSRGSSIGTTVLPRGHNHQMMKNCFYQSFGCAAVIQCQKSFWSSRISPAQQHV